MSACVQTHKHACIIHHVRYGDTRLRCSRYYLYCVSNMCHTCMISNMYLTCIIDCTVYKAYVKHRGPSGTRRTRSGFRRPAEPSSSRASLEPREEVVAGDGLGVTTEGGGDCPGWFQGQPSPKAPPELLPPRVVPGASLPRPHAQHPPARGDRGQDPAPPRLQEAVPTPSTGAARVVADERLAREMNTCVLPYGQITSRIPRGWRHSGFPLLTLPCSLLLPTAHGEETASAS